MQDMTFVGRVGIRDELRPEAVEAIKTAKRAGIQVVMVTGDKKETAAAIARDAKLIAVSYTHLPLRNPFLIAF